MVAKEKVPLGGIEFSIEPTNKLRMKLERWHIYLPYFHGGKPKFKLVLTRLSEAPQIHTVYWLMIFSNGDRTKNELEIPELEIGDKRERVIGDKLLGYVGSTNLVISQFHNNNYHTLYSFRTVAPEDFMVPALISALITFCACLLAM
jgi:hypothetical protein